MNTKRLIDNKEIISLIKSGNYADASVRLLNLQREEWGELAKGYKKNLLRIPTLPPTEK